MVGYCIGTAVLQKAFCKVQTTQQNLDKRKSKGTTDGLDCLNLDLPSTATTTLGFHFLVLRVVVIKVIFFLTVVVLLIPIILVALCRHERPRRKQQENCTLERLQLHGSYYKVLQKGWLVDLLLYQKDGSSLLSLWDTSGRTPLREGLRERL